MLIDFKCGQVKQTNEERERASERKSEQVKERRERDRKRIHTICLIYDKCASVAFDPE